MNQKLFIDITKENVPILIKGKDISKLKVSIPITAHLDCDCRKIENEYHLTLSEQFLSSYVGDKQIIMYRDSFLPFRNTVQIFVPNDWIVNLKINSENGMIFLKNIIFEDIRLNSIRSKIEIKECCSKSTIIESVKSDIHLIKTTGKYSFIHTTTGNIFVEDSSVIDSHYITDTGDIFAYFIEDILKDTSLKIESKEVKTTLSSLQKKKNITCISPYGKFHTNIF